MGDLYSLVGNKLNFGHHQSMEATCHNCLSFYPEHVHVCKQMTLVNTVRGDKLVVTISFIGITEQNQLFGRCFYNPKFSLLPTKEYRSPIKYSHVARK
jgi:hypothetical protein